MALAIAHISIADFVPFRNLSAQSRAAQIRQPSGLAEKPLHLVGQPVPDAVEDRLDLVGYRERIAYRVALVWSLTRSPRFLSAPY